MKLMKIVNVAMQHTKLQKMMIGVLLAGLLIHAVSATRRVNDLDWLVDDVKSILPVSCSAKDTISLSNGLVELEFTIFPDFGKIDMRSYISDDTHILRAVNPEGQFTLDGVTYSIGGLTGQQQFAYFNRSGESINLQRRPDVDSGGVVVMHFVSFAIGEPIAPYEWTPGSRFASKDLSWPPKGKRLEVCFKFNGDLVGKGIVPAAHESLLVKVNYEMYDGLPIWTKYISIENCQDCVLETITLEKLAVNRPFSPSVYWGNPPSSDLTDYGLLFVAPSFVKSTNITWTVDEHARSSPGANEPLLLVQNVNKLLTKVGTHFDSFRVYFMVLDSHTDLERRGLSMRRFITNMAPQTNENPIYMHLTPVNNETFYNAIEQMADVGFEMMIMSFGSGFDFESQDQAYREQVASWVEYGRSRGIEVGGYDEIGYGRGGVKPEDAAIDPATGKPYWGLCFATQEEANIRELLLDFIDFANLSVVETDGPYLGYSCNSTTHAFHINNDDSIFKQELMQAKMYSEFRKRGAFITAPDRYWLIGSNKNVEGYDENQYSLPRWVDLTISRQGLYDDTYHNPTTLGWMFVPLTGYHTGDPRSTFEPLSEHYKEYSWALQQYLAQGIAACWRGNKLYDSESTKQLASRWVKFYKTHRDLLNGDIIHVRRPDLQGIDCMVHVNPRAEEFKAMASVFNPTLDTISKEPLQIPLYYSGIRSEVVEVYAVSDDDPYVPKLIDVVKMDFREHTIEVSISLHPLTILHLFFK
jgi:hypothetical protein